MTGLPWTRDDDRELVHVGASYSHEFLPGGRYSFSPPPESFLAATAGEHERAAPERLARVAAGGPGRSPGARGRHRARPVSFQGELVYNWVQRAADRRTLEYWGYYLMASWFVTGEHRDYDRPVAFFGAVEPREPFDPRKGQWGALQLGARYSYLDANDGNPPLGAVQNDFAFAVNWFANRYLRLSANYIYAKVYNQDDAHILQGRIQIEY